MKKTPLPNSNECYVSKVSTAPSIVLLLVRYGVTVKVYTAGDPDGLWYSKEICGGPHVEGTGSLGHFRITKEESSSAGVRRIRAVLE